MDPGRRLSILSTAVLVPIILLAGIGTREFWGLQRSAYEQQFLERVSALRLALDTELEATIRALGSLAEGFDAAAPQASPAFQQRMALVASHNPAWDALGLVRADGSVVARVDRPGSHAVNLDRATLEDVVQTARPAFSNLVQSQPGRYITFIAVPVKRSGAVRGAVYVAISPHAWLSFLRRYPVSEDATLTLNDRNRRIIARTLNPEKWVGKQSSAAFWDRTVGKMEGAYAAPGLEGQSFYAAFSRSRESGWLLGTGVPRERLDAALRLPTAILAAGLLLALALAVVFALVLGGSVREISQGGEVRPAGRRVRPERASGADGEFLAVLGQELRGPLSAMKNALAMLDSSGNESTTGARAALERQLRQLGDIVEELLDVSRLTSGRVVLTRQVLDLAEVARHVVACFADSGRSRHLRVETSLERALVFADEARLRQIIENLLDNACKYTQAGRSVRIAVSARGGDAILRIADEGSGIAPELLAGIFHLFQTDWPRGHGGPRLGLAVVRRLVELHGGTVEAQSDGEHRGAAFVVRLPRALDESATAAGNDEAESAPMRMQNEWR